MKTSVIISFYERLTHLKCCLQSLALCRQDFTEVIITDDGSSAATVRELERLLPTFPFAVRHVRQEKNGFRLAASRNNGIQAACGDYLIFLDCDFVVLPDTIRRHLEVAKPGMVVAALCKYLPQPETETLLHAPFSGDLLERFYHKLPERPIRREHLNFVKNTLLLRLHLIGPRKPKCSSHYSIHRQDIERVNGYDENFVGWGGEDEDLSMRLFLAGIKGFSAIRSARVLHLWHPQELGGNSWQAGTNVAYLFRDGIPFRCENGLSKGGSKFPDV